MIRNNYTTQQPKKERWIIWLVIGVFAIGMFMGAALACTVYMSNAQAEDGWYYSCWVMCQPGSEVLIRDRPGKGAPVVGAASCGQQLWTDWEERDGWIRLVDVNNETGTGWISEQYVVFDIPYHINAEGVIKGKGRVACRDAVDGKRTGWASPGDMLAVYWVSSEWAVTDRGYISTDYLEVP